MTAQRNETSEETPATTLEWIIAENPHATKEQIKRLFRDEVRSSENLQNAIFDSVFELDYGSENNALDAAFIAEREQNDPAAVERAIRKERKRKNP